MREWLYYPFGLCSTGGWMGTIEVGEVWGVGAVDLSEQVVRIKGYSA